MLECSTDSSGLYFIVLQACAGVLKCECTKLESDFSCQHCKHYQSPVLTISSFSLIPRMIVCRFTASIVTNAKLSLYEIYIVRICTAHTSTCRPIHVPCRNVHAFVCLCVCVRLCVHACVSVYVHVCICMCMWCISICRSLPCAVVVASYQAERRLNNKVFDLQDRLDQEKHNNRSMENYVSYLKASYSNVFGDSTIGAGAAYSGRGSSLGSSFSSPKKVR